MIETSVTKDEGRHRCLDVEGREAKLILFPVGGEQHLCFYDIPNLGQKSVLYNRWMTTQLIFGVII